MEAKLEHKAFLVNEIPKLLELLEENAPPRFGLMTPQHMVEHLSYTMKGVLARHGEVQDPPTKGQLGFKKFIQNGAIFQYRPSDKTKADLPKLKYATFEEAKADLVKAVQRFYDHFEANPDFKCYNDFLGELDFDELSLFEYMHFRHHFYQFGLIAQYP
jgi:hypothetical protein